MANSKNKLKKDYDDLEKVKKEKKASKKLLEYDILNLEAEQSQLQSRWQSLEDINPS